MQFWTAAVVIVAIVFTWLMIDSIMRNATAKKGNKLSADAEARLDKMEKRLENLETVVLEKEKAAKYDQL